jgi:hypothetical protein
MAENRDARRYREAAERVLEQLDWAINYLHRIRKHKLADALARNRDTIRRRLRNQPSGTSSG